MLSLAKPTDYIGGMGIIKTYLDTIEPKRRAEMERIYDLVWEIEPAAEEGTSYGMPCMVYKTKGLLAVMATKDYLSCYPLSGKVIAAMGSTLEPLEHTAGSIHLSRTTPITKDQLTQLIDLRQRQIDKLW